MSFSSLLSQIKNKTPPPPQSSKTQTSDKPAKRPASAPANESRTVIRKVDPAVERLKELRRQEKAEKEAALAATKANTPKPARPRTASRARTSSSTPITSRRLAFDAPVDTRPRSSSPPKRLTFAELMKQGKEKTKQIQDDPPSKSTEHKYISKTKPVTSKVSKSTPKLTSSRPATTRPGSKLHTAIPRNSAIRKPEPRTPPAPKPLAQPSAALKAKLEARKKKQNIVKARNSKSSRGGYYDDYEEEEEDDFIVHDDDVGIEVEEEEGYDRDEIWKMFNRGKSRRDYNESEDDLSDMEADGADIFDEEEEAERAARLEEKREMERERRRIEEKKRRLGRK